MNDKALELKTCTGLVKHILEQDRQTRNSDSLLYLRVLEHIAETKEINLQSLTVPAFLTTMQDDFPGFETIRRTRQMMQRKFPELSAKASTAQNRADAEAVFREFARGDLIG